MKLSHVRVTDKIIVSRLFSVKISLVGKRDDLNL